LSHRQPLARCSACGVGSVASPPPWGCSRAGTPVPGARGIL
jgi:hypothetical protein